VAAATLEEMPSSYILIPKLPLAWYSCTDLKLLSRELLAHLETVLSSHRYERVILVGHSAGGVLAQAMYLMSWDTEILRGARLVLIAPLSRGWDISHHMPLTKKLAWSVGLLLMPMVRLVERLRSLMTLRQAQPPWILQLRKSSPFLVWLRLSWLELHKRHPENEHEVVQLLGSIDELVSWRDMVDAATGQSVVYLEAPCSDHVSILDFEDGRSGEARKETFVKALRAIDLARLSEVAVEPWDTDPIPPDPNVRRVVFVIHGIRDEGHWTQKIAARAKQEFAARPGHDRSQIEVVTSSYGYFSMLQFLRYKQRRSKVSWLVEEYVEAKRRFPSAEFSFIGHSNGTYLAAHALERFPEITFERLVFAGSVVSTQFDWQGLGERAKYVLNYAATTDWVVGIFPRIADLLPLRWLLGPSLGGAGIESFPDSKQVKTLRYRKGQHSAAIKESNWPNLARFAVADPAELKSLEEHPADPDQYLEERARLFGPIWGRLTCVVVWVAALALLVVGLPWLAWSKPAYLWLAPLPLLAGSVLAIALAEELGGRVGLRARKKLRRVLTYGFGGAVLLSWLWLISVSPVQDLLCQWNQPREAVRALSFLCYFFFLHRALTRV
jgi:pimeloyl-ACP methyl ester carboxylesterase